MLERGCGCSVDGEKLRWKVYIEEVRSGSGRRHVALSVCKVLRHACESDENAASWLWWEAIQREGASNSDAAL